MNWFAVIRSDTGEAISMYSDAALQQPDPTELANRGLEIVAIDHQPGEGERWDAEARAVVAIKEPEPAP